MSKGEQAEGVVGGVNKKYKFSKTTAVIVLTVFLLGVAGLSVDAKTRNERILTVFKDGTEYVIKISRKLRNKDIAKKAGISYSKLNLKHSIKSSDLKDGVIAAVKLENGTITTVKIKDGAITSGKIADGTILEFDLSDGSVATSKLQNNSITDIKLADDSVITAKIEDLAVTTAKLRDGSVTDAKILDATISGGKLQDGSISTVKLADDSVTTAKVVDGTLQTADLSDGIITAVKLADGSVETVKILDGAITAGKIANGAVVEVALADGAVSTAKVQDNAITGIKLADGTVTSAKIEDLAVTTSKLADDAVITSKILDASIVSGKIADSAITPAKLADASVTTAKIADAAVTNVKLGDDAVTSEKIQDGTITQADLDPSIALGASGDISVDNITASGDITADNIQASGDVTADNIQVSGDVTGDGTLGRAGSRWSTIYADTVNFLSGLTNADNTSGANSTIDLGTASGDAANIAIGNATAQVVITSENWSVASNGRATLNGINLQGDITSDSSRLIDLANGSDTTLTIDNSGVGVANLQVTGAGIFGGTLTAGGQFVVTAGGMDVTGDSDLRGALNLHNNVLTNIGNDATDFTASGGLNLAGLLTANGGIDLNGHDVAGVRNLNASGDITANRYRVGNTGGITKVIALTDNAGATCTMTITGGIVTATTCP